MFCLSCYCYCLQNGMLLNTLLRAVRKGKTIWLSLTKLPPELGGITICYLIDETCLPVSNQCLSFLFRHHIDISSRTSFRSQYRISLVIHATAGLQGKLLFHTGSHCWHWTCWLLTARGPCALHQGYSSTWRLTSTSPLQGPWFGADSCLLFTSVSVERKAVI